MAYFDADGLHVEDQQQYDGCSYFCVPSVVLDTLRALQAGELPNVGATIRWRGSVSDLATDCAALLTRGQGYQLLTELQRFLRDSQWSGKFLLPIE